MFNLFNIVMTRRFLVPSVAQQNKVSPLCCLLFNFSEMAMSISNQGIDNHKGEMPAPERNLDGCSRSCRCSLSSFNGRVHVSF
jgi:hypothetical protein